MLARVYVDGGEEGVRVRLQVLDGRVTPCVVRVGEVAELRRVVGFVRRVGSGVLPQRALGARREAQRAQGSNG